MAIEILDAIQIMKMVLRVGIRSRLKLLVLGDANILFTKEMLNEQALELGFPLITVPGELDIFNFGLALGFGSVDTLDINGKASIKFNLQDRLDVSMESAYDVIIDAGVLFWCFNPGIVLGNVYRMLKAGGMVFHINALTGYYGRGYYNIHPQLFRDFYRSNECSFLGATFRVRSGRKNWRGVALGYLRKLFTNKTSLITMTDNYDAIFVDCANVSSVFFKDSLAIPEPSMLPNNTVMMYVVKKGSRAAPVDPIYIG